MLTSPKKTIKHLVLASTLFACVNAYTNVEAEGRAEITCKKGSAEEFEKVKKEALVNALNQWAQDNKDFYRAYRQKRDLINSNPMDFILESRGYLEEFDRNRKKCSMELTADINALEIFAVLLDDIPKEDRQGITFMFVNREQQDKNSAIWEEGAVTKLENKIIQTFNQMDFRGINAARFINESGFNPAAIGLNYASTGNIDKQVIASAVDGLNYISSKPIQYLALAAMEIGTPTKDQTTDNSQITATVSGEVFNIETGEFGGNCSVTRTGEGRNFMEAKHNAMTLAADGCAVQIIGQMISAHY